MVTSRLVTPFLGLAVTRSRYRGLPYTRATWWEPCWLDSRWNPCATSRAWYSPRTSLILCDTSHKDRTWPASSDVATTWKPPSIAGASSGHDVGSKGSSCAGAPCMRGKLTYDCGGKAPPLAQADKQGTEMAPTKPTTLVVRGLCRTVHHENDARNALPGETPGCLH